ncbi:MAG: DUF2232 domain-containing protein [Thermodesulfobacteriota bacterium]
MGRGRLVWLICLSALLAGFLGAQVNPLAYLLVGVLTPLPVLVAGWRSGELAALLLALAALVLIFSLNPALDTLWQNLGFLNLLAMGVLLTSLQWRGVWAPQAIILTVMALNGLAVLIFLGQALYLGMTPHDLLAQKTAEVMETVGKVLGDAGGGSPDPLIPGIPQGEVRVLLERLLPGLMVANSALVAWLNVVLARQLCFLLGWGEPEPPLNQWVAPEWLIFALLGAGFLLLVPVSGVRFIGLNLLLVLAVLYFAQGLAVISTWFHRLGLPKALRMIGYPLMFLNPVFFLIIALGLMDLWLDFRRLHRPKES